MKSPHHKIAGIPPVEVALPSIHSNGTSKASLVKGYADLLRALNDATRDRRVNEAPLNARDYYPRPGSFEAARKDFDQHVKNLCDFRDWAQAMAFGIQDGGHDAID